MARTVVTTPLTDADLLAFVEEQSDFQFEMRVNKACTQSFTQVEHGGHYLDDNTGKKRQFDIRARHLGTHSSLSLAIECKNLHPSHPLLISRVPRTEEESFHDLVTFAHFAYLPASYRLRAHLSMFLPGEMVGKAMAHVSKTLITEDKRSESRAEFSSKDTEIYDKWAQAVASAHELVGRASSMHHGLRAHAILPVLVVPNDSLWKVDYRQSGERESDPVRIKRCDFFLGTSANSLQVTHTFSHLLIFTFAGFEEFIDDLTMPVSPLKSQWQKLFPLQYMQQLLTSV